VEYYNTVRLHPPWRTIGYIAPIDKLQGREKMIFQQRDCKSALADKGKETAKTPERKQNKQSKN